MSAVAFQDRFVPAIVSEIKEHTIRKRKFKCGEILKMFTGWRTPAVKRFGTAVATHSEPVKIIFFTNADGRSVASVFIKDRDLSPCEIGKLARADGFNSAAEFLDFFEKKYGKRFEGWLNHWTGFSEVTHEQ